MAGHSTIVDCCGIRDMRGGEHLLGGQGYRDQATRDQGLGAGGGRCRSLGSGESKGLAR